LRFGGFRGQQESTTQLSLEAKATCALRIHLRRRGQVVAALLCATAVGACARPVAAASASGSRRPATGALDLQGTSDIVPGFCSLPDDPRCLKIPPRDQGLESHCVPSHLRPGKKEKEEEKRGLFRRNETKRRNWNYFTMPAPHREVASGLRKLREARFEDRQSRLRGSAARPISYCSRRAVPVSIAPVAGRLGTRTAAQFASLAPSRALWWAPLSDAWDAKLVRFEVSMWKIVCRNLVEALGVLHISVCWIVATSQYVGRSNPADQPQHRPGCPRAVARPWKPQA